MYEKLQENTLDKINIFPVLIAVFHDNDMKNAIAIVIVTYNRLSMLKMTLQACLKQPMQRIFVINNGSTDGTKEYLDIFSAREQRIAPRHMLVNIGGSGGFAEGMRLAHAAGYEWIWLMDDDVEPVPGGLQALAAQAAGIGKPCCLYPAKQCADGRLFDFEYSISRRTLRRRRISSLDKPGANELVPSNSCCFEGAFLHRETINKIGFPDSRFFMCWDDAFYGMRAAEYLECYYLNTVCIKKQFDKERLRIGGKGYFSSSLFSRCHFLRNYWEVLRYLKVRHELSALAYAIYAWECIKAAAITVLADRNLSGLTQLWQAVSRGWRGDFTPLKMDSK